jgi:hypothetical protein
MTGSEAVGAGETASGTTAGASADLAPMFAATEMIDFLDLINDVNKFTYARWL